MEIRLSRYGDKAVLDLTGELTIYEAAATKERLLAPLAEVSELEMNLADVSEIDTAGVQLLILTKQEAVATGKSLRLTGHSRPVVELLELYGLDAWFGDPLVLPAETSGSGGLQ